MDEELQKLVTQMIEAGVSDDKVKSFIQEYSPQEQSGFVGSLGKSIKSTVVNQMPQSGANFVGREASQTNKQIEEGTGVAGFIDKYITRNLISKEDYEQYKQRRQQLPLGLEVSSQKFKQQAGEDLKGVTQSFSDIHDATSAGSYIGQALGQGLGQIPAAVATSGASSYIMEAGIIYDQQLDLLAEKHGISREEVLKKGLDKPAEGEAYALLAAGLDAVSAGSVLSIFRKAAAKEAVKGGIKKLAKEFITGFGTEAATEGTQNVLETLGGAKGAGVEANIDPNAVINDALSGGIGGGGIQSVASINLRKKPEAKVEPNVATEHDIQLPDTRVNNAIDLEYAHAAKQIDDLLEAHKIDLTKDLEDATVLPSEGNTTSGADVTASAPGIQSTTEPVQPTTGDTTVPAASASAEPVTNANNNVPVVEAPKTEPVSLYHTSKAEVSNIGDQHTNGGIMHTWKKGSNNSIGLFTVAPSLNGQINPDNREDVGKITGKIEEANKNFPASKFGPNTYQIESTKPLNLLKTKDSGMDLHVDTIIEAARKSKAVNQEALEAVIQRTSGYQNHEKQAALAAFLRTPEGGSFDGVQYKNVVEKVAKVVKDEGSEEPTFIEKANNIVKKRRPSQIISALESLRERASEKGLTGAVAHIDKHIDEFNKIKEAVEEKPIKKFKEEPVKKEPKKATHKGVTRNLNAIKSDFYKKIGIAKTEYAKQLALDKYEDFRKENNLPALTEARKKTLLGFQVTQGKAAEKLSQRQSLEERDEAVKKIKEEIGAEFGIDPETIEDVSFTGQKSMIEFLEEHNEAKDVLKMPREEISVEEFNNLAPKSQKPLLEALQRVVGKYKSKEGTGLKILKITVPKEAKIPNMGGFHFSLSKSDNSYIVILVDEATGKPIVENNSILHEYLHEYTKMMFHRLYKTNKSFSAEVNKAYKKVTSTVLSKTQDLFTKLITKAELTEEDNDLVTNIFGVLGERLGPEKISILEHRMAEIREAYNLSPNYSFARLAALQLASGFYTDFYAFKNAHEMMAEVFSDPHTAMFLSKIKLDETIQSGINKGEQKSLLYKWYSDLIGWVQDQFKQFEIGRVANNALEHFVDVIASFDQEFINGDLQRQPDYSIFTDFTPQEAEDFEADINALNFTRISKKAVKTYRKIVNNLTYTIETKKDMDTLAEVSKYLQGVNAHLPAGKKLDVAAYAPKILNKIKRLRKQRVIAKAHQVKLLNNARNNPLYKTSWKYMEDVEDMAKVNIDDLRLKAGNNEVIAYVNGLGLLSINGILSKRQYDIMINYGKKMRMLEELMPLAKNLNQTFMKGLPDIANPSTFTSILSKYDTNTANKILKNIYGGSMKSMARASIEATNFFQDLNKLAEASNFTHKDLARIGLYGGIFSTVNAPSTKQWETEVIANAQAAYDAAKNKKQAKDEDNYRGSLKDKYIDNEIAHAKEILDAVKVGKKDILTPAQQKLYNKIRDFAEKHQDDFERNSVGGWGIENFQRRYNYFPTLAQGSINKGGQLRDTELLRDQSDNLMEALSSDGSRGTYGYVYGKKVWSNFRRTNPKGYYYENDALAIAKKWSKSMLYDLYATKELKAINRVLEDRTFQKEFKVKVRDAFKYHLRSISGAANKFDPEAAGIFRTMMKVRDKLYTAALATSGQILLQSSSGFAAAAVLSAHLNPVTSMQSFSKAVKAAMGSLGATSKLQKFLEKEGMGIQLRDILFEKYLSAEDYQNYLAGIKVKGLANKIENVTEWSLRAGDKLGARLVWFAAYFNAGGTLDSPSRDSVLAAERMTGVMQNMSDMSFSAPAFKYNTAAQKILMGMFYAFKAFSLNSALNIWYSGRHSLSSKEARQVLAGQLGSILAYHTLAVMAIKPLIYDPITRAVTGLLGGDDDDDDEKRTSFLEEILTTSLWDLGIGMWSPSMLDGLLRWVYNKNVAPSIHGSPYEDFDQYADSPIYSVKQPEDLYKDMLGPGFKEMAQESIDLIKLLSDQAAADAYLEDIDKAEKRGEKWEDFVIKTIGTVYGGTSGMPLRGDVKRILDGVARKRAAQRAKAGKKKQSGQGEPAYAFPEYDLNSNF